MFDPSVKLDAGSKSKKAFKIIIVCDTNIIYTKSPYYLVNREVFDLIRKVRDHPDVDFRWILPDVVVQEREYRMIERALGLLDLAREIAQLIEKSPKLTPEFLTARVAASIKEHIETLGLERKSLDLKDVDWDGVIQDAIRRQPPFEKQTEKGFRDRLILETLLQVISDSPKSQAQCQVVFISGDELLRNAAKSRTDGMKQVRIVDSLVNFESLLNARFANLPEEYVTTLRSLATSFFFEKEVENSVYYSLSVRRSIRKSFASALAELPQGANNRKISRWRISPPHFLEKAGDRVHWLTVINVYSDATVDFGKTAFAMAIDWPAKLQTSVQSVPLSATDPEKQSFQVAAGKTVFEVYWSVHVSAENQFTTPSIDKLECLGTEWKRQSINWALTA
jgi:hypothetical protein